MDCADGSEAFQRGPAVTFTCFAYRVDLWSDDEKQVVEHLADLDDLTVALATYHAACKRWPGKAITLRHQGVHGRVRGVRAGDDSGTSPRGPSAGQGRGKEAWSASDSPRVGRTHQKGS